MTEPLEVRLRRILGKVDELIATRDTLEKELAAAIAAKEAAERLVGTCKSCGGIYEHTPECSPEWPSDPEILQKTQAKLHEMVVENDRLFAELTTARAKLSEFVDTCTSQVAELAEAKEEIARLEHNAREDEAHLRDMTEQRESWSKELSAAVARAEAAEARITEFLRCAHACDETDAELEKMRPVVEAARNFFVDEEGAVKLQDALRALDASPAAEKPPTHCVCNTLGPDGCGARHGPDWAWVVGGNRNSFYGNLGVRYDFEGAWVKLLTETIAAWPEEEVNVIGYIEDNATFMSTSVNEVSVRLCAAHYQLKELLYWSMPEEQKT